ncbi:group II intron reverse transcriptase/maturase [Parashewanella curva]|uniref:group II intron reverse transcriptase/maturase n=1 Tax=Parashewanella curva TaxID=2338552 RepID=UPI001FB3DEF3|nr:group II intron reverse transcriptase/maturase [Parashewanella curva]
MSIPTTSSDAYSQQRTNPQPAFKSELFQQTFETENMHKAWKRVKANKGAAGIDGMSLEQFPKWAEAHWPQCKAQLLQGKYQPSPVRRVEIDKPDGGKRQLGIPTVIDRVIQQAISQTLTPLFEPFFSENSFGFRPNRNGKQAVEQVQRIIKQKRNIAVDVDLSKFFDRVNHDLLMTHISKKLKDKSLLQLIGKYLRTGVMKEGLTSPSYEGVPQGSPLSPLLSNIMLDNLDKELERRGHKFARYADDCVPRAQAAA